MLSSPVLWPGKYFKEKMKKITTYGPNTKKQIEEAKEYIIIHKNHNWIIYSIMVFFAVSIIVLFAMMHYEDQAIKDIQNRLQLEECL